MKKVILGLVLASQYLWAGTFLEDNVYHLNEAGHEVVWIADEKFPTFSLSIYFQDGALKDNKDHAGLTKTSFDLLSSGTSDFSQKQISDFFDFFGASLSSTVTHEYSLYQVAGLLKDSDKILNKVCHLFQKANYPENEVESFKSRLMSSFKNLPTNHSALAERAFRFYLLEGTPFESPTDGTIKSISKLKREDLLKRLEELKKAHKRYYITGPKGVVKIAKHLDQCGFTSTMTSQEPINWKKNKSKIVFVPVEGANQAQIRLGQLFFPSEIINDNRDMLSADYLGGGFTSKLVQELRVKRGLTYGASAHLSAQKNFVRAGLATFTKNETLDETLKVIKSILVADSDPKMIKAEDVNHIKKYSIGSYPFTFEQLLPFVSQLILLDHRGKNYSILDNFVNDINLVTKEELATNISKFYSWDNMILVVIGHPSMEKILKKWGTVQKVKVNDLL